MIRRALLLACLLLLLTAGVLSADDASTLDDYRRAVDQALQSVTRAESVATDQRAALLDQAIVSLRTIHAVQVAPDAQVSVHNDTLIAALQAAQKNPQSLSGIQSARARLQALRQSLDQIPSVASAEDRAALRDLLNGPPFKASPDENFLVRALRDLLDRLAHLFDGVRVGNPGLSGDWLVVLGMVFALGVLVYFLRTLARNLAPETELGDKAGGERLTYTAALKQAHQLASVGDYRSAIRELYLATLLLLDEREQLHYDLALTNREYLRAVADRPSVFQALQPIVETFDRTWYGFEPVGEDEFQAFRRRVQTVQDL